MTTVETHHLVTVSLTITTPDGETQTVEKTIKSGLTKVTALKEELGAPAEDSLWLITKHGKKKLLSDHESHDVKADDHYEVVGKGGVS